MSTISDTPASIGTIALPTSGIVILEDSGVQYPNFHLTFALTNARVPVIDAGASGSSGTLKLFDFVKGVVHMQSSYQNYTAMAEGAALTTGAGNAAFKLGLGSVGLAVAADNALTTTSVNFGAAVSITDVAGTGAGTAVTATNVSIDGTGTAVDLYLNFSGSAASINASSYLDVTGTITVEGRFAS